MGSLDRGASPLFQSLPELGGGALGSAVLEVEDCGSGGDELANMGNLN